MSTAPSLPRGALQALLDCLENDLRLMQAFVETLEHESRLLDSLDDTAALETCARHKSSHAAALSAADASRNAALAQCALPSGKAGLDRAASLHPDVAAACARLLALADRARQLNDANGIVIESCARHYADALHDLRRMLDSGALYDAQGRNASAPSPNRPRIVAG